MSVIGDGADLARSLIDDAFDPQRTTGLQPAFIALKTAQTRRLRHGTRDLPSLSWFRFWDTVRRGRMLSRPGAVSTLWGRFCLAQTIPATIARALKR
jgi:hypothetical protein